MVTKASKGIRRSGLPLAAGIEDSGSTLIQRLDRYDDLLPLHHAHPERYPCLLESVSHGTPQSCYDILFAATDERLILHRPGGLSARGVAAEGADFLANLDRWWMESRCPEIATPDLPFHGGWFVYLGYELAAQTEPRLAPVLYPTGTLPLAAAVRCPAAIVRDHARRHTYLVTERDHAHMLGLMMRDLEQKESCAGQVAIHFEQALSEDDPDHFLVGVRRIQEYITAGDVFQVNLSRAWSGRLRAGTRDTEIYHRLRRCNPAPFAGLARIDDMTVISSSPERLFMVRGNQIETRPIAGTRPRGADAVADAMLSQRLLSHPKERAEHIMLIDLARNDLGRLCVPGSIRVRELMTLESYAHVHHIVSNVEGRLDAGITPGQIIRAVFPGGTITGCPKIRCMEIISELEQCARGAYTGALGYLDRNGNMDFNILIRTLVRNEDDIVVRAGAGIVADSSPDRELAETRAKARGLLQVFSG